MRGLVSHRAGSSAAVSSSGTAGALPGVNTAQSTNSFSGILKGDMDVAHSASRPRRRHPPWLKVRAPFGEQVHRLKNLLGGLGLNTVCQEAMCPNLGECWSHGVATFMILGDICTRGCRYCAVGKGRPAPLNAEEPRQVAEAVKAMGLGHVVITSVDRDDLEDGGASVFAETIARVREQLPGCVLEVLVPDFRDKPGALDILFAAWPEIFGHNIETVPRLFPSTRGGGDYQVSLEVLAAARQRAPELVCKTGMMLGLGEQEQEVLEVMQDLLERGVSILTLGQYLRPTAWHLPVARHYHPEEFQEWKERGEALGFEHVEAGPLVRSSYLADRQFDSLRKKRPTPLTQLES